jgi:hypothetical protein
LKKNQEKEDEILHFSKVVYKMIQEVDTRWGTMLSMVSRLLLLITSHNQSVRELNRPDLILSLREKDTMEEIV